MIWSVISDRGVCSSRSFMHARAAYHRDARRESFLPLRRLAAAAGFDRGGRRLAPRCTLFVCLRSVIGVHVECVCLMLSLWLWCVCGMVCDCRAILCVYFTCVVAVVVCRASYMFACFRVILYVKQISCILYTVCILYGSTSAQLSFVLLGVKLYNNSCYRQSAGE